MEWFGHVWRTKNDIIKKALTEIIHKIISYHWVDRERNENML